mgnify:CR=1 FL=1
MKATDWLSQKNIAQNLPEIRQQKKRLDHCGQEEKCVSCGGTLEFTYERDMKSNRVSEQAFCPTCEKHGTKRIYPLV